MLVQDFSKKRNILSYFLGTTVLYEFVHWGENNNPDFFYWGEEGVQFEIRAYGYDVNPDTANLALNILNN